MVFLSFEKFLVDDAERSDFGKARYLKNSKERQNISKLVLDSDSGCAYLNAGDANRTRFNNATGERYVCAIDLTFDAFFSAYDTNSRALFACRFVDFDARMQTALGDWLAHMKKGNVEVRIIGMQNNNVRSLLSLIYGIKKLKLNVCEADLFGGEVRHIAIDSKTGASFDVLVNNKLYKPGELNNTLTVEQFEREHKPAPKPGLVGIPKRKTV